MKDRALLFLPLEDIGWRKNDVISLQCDFNSSIWLGLVRSVGMGPHTTFSSTGKFENGSKEYSRKNDVAPTSLQCDLSGSIWLGLVRSVYREPLFTSSCNGKFVNGIKEEWRSHHQSA